MDDLLGKAWSYVPKSSAFWTALFNGLLVLFTCLLWKVASRQNETERASVVVKTINEAISSDRAIIVVVFTNAGHLTAEKVQIETRIAHVALPPNQFDPDAIAPTRFTGPKSTLGPGLEIKSSKELKDWKPDELDQLASNKEYLYVVTRVRYEDGFGTIRTSDPLCFWRESNRAIGGYNVCGQSQDH